MNKYINADEARNRIMDNCGKYLATELDENGEFRNGILTALNAIVTMPSADVVEVKHGKWEEDSGNIACSECHTIWLYRRTDFCPNCGADMRGGMK